MSSLQHGDVCVIPEAHHEKDCPLLDRDIIDYDVKPYPRWFRVAFWLGTAVFGVLFWWLIVSLAFTAFG